MRLALQRAGLAGCATGYSPADSLRCLLEALCDRMRAHRAARTRLQAAAEPRPERNGAFISGRRCLRADLDRRDRVVALALRKERLVGPPARGFDQAGGRPLKRGRRFEYVRPSPDGAQSRTSPST